MTDWFRSWHGAPTDPKWRTIAKRAGVSPSIVVSLAWVLLDRASQADARGSIDGADVESIADFLGCDADEVERVIVAMHDKAVLASDRFVAWEKRQPKREREDDTAAERKAAQRARDKAKNGSGDGGTGQVTPSHTTSHQVTPREEERRLDTPSPNGDGRQPAADREPEFAFRSQPEPSRPSLRVVDGDVLPPKFDPVEVRDPPVDPDAAYYRRGREVLGGNAGAMLTNLKKHFGGNIGDARAVIEHAATRDGPSAYVAGVIAKPTRAGPQQPRAAPVNPRLAASRQLAEYLDAQPH